ncbi:MULTISPECIES: ABC transporter permease [Pedobacter]|uniref:Transport permease protein n=1 Tax=Pedobacter heparinus (strain ATCC 13125 / DSM 2366 / CIP 104194 / JCM 7457 / NBRC 12017 / NCIMB 9290 / NRRL B-14731 / HIM 762-3) TaxID=485917 RepID=C6XVL0_PEDHD|nr:MULTISPECIES: ABC transporter permease [Pedobacter]ACU06085.1 ABC-2 type transporter [Pedobacter heparinus DSM 2366]MBB5438871.1 lipopolysaccharide transport system permease protein [Pedobacter sp. AK017]
MKPVTEETWDMEIRPKNSLIELKLRDVWHYRDLLVLLVKRDFVSFYKQTILGPLWFFIQPIFTTITFTFIFGNLAGISTDGLPQPLFYMAGITAWNYFSDCLNKTSTVFKDNTNLFGKVYFPRLIMPLSIVASNLVRFGVQMLLFVLMIVYYLLTGKDFGPNWYLLLFPVLIVLMACLGLGLGMIISAMTTRYRDLSFLVSFGVQLLMYATTVIYPLSTALEKYPAYAWIIEYNPMTPIIETFRYGFLGRGSFSWQNLGYCTFITFCITFLGVVVFNKVEKTFVDTI